MVGEIGGPVMKHRDMGYIPARLHPFGLYIWRKLRDQNKDVEYLTRRTGYNREALLRVFRWDRQPPLDMFLAVAEILSEDREEFDRYIMSMLEQTGEYQMARRRLRAKENKTNKPIE